MWYATYSYIMKKREAVYYCLECDVVWISVTVCFKVYHTMKYYWDKVQCKFIIHSLQKTTIPFYIHVEQKIGSYFRSKFSQFATWVKLNTLEYSYHIML
jgi:hypothetical protein